jgi:hypothetical protein
MRMTRCASIDETHIDRIMGDAVDVVDITELPERFLSFEV